jgi:hypothetical protein
VAPGIAERQPAQDRDSVVHLLPAKLVVDEAVPAEQGSREDVVRGLRLLKAKHIRALLDEQALDEL